ncbi:hypothetical protein [Amycolatopsis plumensis]
MPFDDLLAFPQLCHELLSAVKVAWADDMRRETGDELVFGRRRQ